MKNGPGPRPARVPEPFRARSRGPEVKFVMVTGPGRGFVRRNDEATIVRANRPQKSNDPAKEALSAIEDALRMRGDESTPPLRPMPPVEGERRSGGDLFQDDVTPPAWAEESPVRRAANDDRAAIGKILQTLQRRP